MPVSMLNAVFNQMQPGEIYAPDSSGTGGEYILPRESMVAGPSGDVNDLSRFRQQTGVQDYNNQRTGLATTDRMNTVADVTGAKITGLEQNTQFSPEAVQTFKSFSPADQMAIQLVNEGKLDPKDFYATLKGSEIKQQEAALNFLQKLDAGKNKMDLMKDGKSIPMSGGNVTDLMNPASGTSVKVGAPYPDVNVNIGADNKMRGYLGLKVSDLSETDKDLIAGVNEGKVLLTNIVDTFKNSGYGGAGSILGEKLAKVPLAGKFLASKNAEFQKQKELASEIWLRAATGAATNPDEIKRYAGFLPDESDPPDLAQSKMDNFFNKVSVKVEGRAQALEVEAVGLESMDQGQLGNVKRVQAQRIRDIISRARASVPLITEQTSFSTPEEVDAYAKTNGWTTPKKITVGGKKATWSP